MTALKAFSLIDATGRPQKELERLVFAEGEERRAVLGDVLRHFYGPVFELDLTRATRGQFHEAFRRFGAREGVLAKCEAFFIQAARDAGIGLSQYITAGRHGARRPTARAPRGPPGRASERRPRARTRRQRQSTRGSYWHNEYLRSTPTSTLRGRRMCRQVG